MALNNTTVRAMKAGETLWDDVVDGLHVRCTGPKRTFYLYYRTKDGVQRRPKLDHWGNITLTQARDAARDIRAKVAAGEDPMADRKKSRGQPTVREAFDIAFADQWKKTKGRDEIKRLFDVHVLPRIGGQRMAHVTYDDIKRIHAALESTPYQANRMLSYATRLFALAERPYEWRPLNSNPCTGIQRYPELKRHRKAEPAEIAKIGPLLAAAAKDNAAGVAFLYLLMFSGARPSEIANATWDQLTEIEHDGRTFGRLAIDDGKTGQLTVYLPPEAMAVIAKLPKVAGRTITGIQSPRTLWRRIRKEAGCPDLRMRDWRRTFASIGLSGGQSLSLVGELLNHKNAQTTKTYAKLMAAPALNAAAANAAMLQEMLG